jgi:hypothetical protein
MDTDLELDLFRRTTEEERNHFCKAQSQGVIWPCLTEECTLRISR